MILTSRSRANFHRNVYFDRYLLFVLECPGEYTFYAGVGCFGILLTHEAVNFDDARQGCGEDGARLATVDSVAKSDAVTHYLTHFTSSEHGRWQTLSTGCGS